MIFVIDTNVWISFLIGNKFLKLKKFILEEKIKVSTSDEQIKEIVRVTERTKFTRYFSEKDVEELVTLLEYFCDNQIPDERIEDCRDVKDNYLLEIAVSGEVDYLVTGDKDLLELNPFRGIEIISLKKFEELLQK